MSDLDFTFNLATLMIVIKVVVILAVAIALNIFQKKMIPKAIIAGIPKIRLETPDQLAARSKTMAYIVALGEKRKGWPSRYRENPAPSILMAMSAKT